MSGTVVSINISKEKGTPKVPVSYGSLDLTGIVGDAHAGPWHRQVSLLSRESIVEFQKELGREINPGEFAENITVSGINLKQLVLGDTLRIGDAELEVTQIGKRCYGDGCSIFSQVGKCVMPKEGIFCRVLRGGPISSGMSIDC